MEFNMSIKQLLGALFLLCFSCINLNARDIANTNTKSYVKKESFEIQIDESCAMNEFSLISMPCGHTLPDCFGFRFTPDGCINAKWASENLPTGVEIDANTGKLSGIPRSAGSYVFRIDLTCDNGDVVQKQFCWRVLEYLKIMNYNIPILEVNIPIKPLILKASGGLPPYTWNVDSLPDGLSFEPQTATIQGIPQSPIQTKITIHVHDSHSTSAQTAEKELNLIVYDDSLTVYPPVVEDTVVNYSYRQFIQANSNSPPCFITMRTGQLPEGMKIIGELKNSEYLDEIEISGRAQKPGIYPLGFMIRDSNAISETIYRDYTITVHDVVTIKTNELSVGERGQSYIECILVEGIEDATITYEMTSGSLPKGLSLNQKTGVISGIIDHQATSALFTIKVLKDVGEYSIFDERELTLFIVDGALIITTSFVRNPRLQNAYVQTIRASNGLKPYQWFVESSIIPQGTQFVEEDNQLFLYGTPTQCGQFHIHAKVKDFLGALKSKRFFFEVTCDENDYIPPQTPIFVKSYPDIQTQSSGIIRVIISQPEIDTDISGYSYVWNTSMSCHPDTTLETNQTEIYSPQLSSGKNHYLHVCAVDTSNNISVPLSVGPFYVTQPKTFVMIVGGGEHDPNDMYWRTTEKLTRQAYMDFFKMGYSHDQIYYAIHALDGIDYDHDNVPDDIVDNYLYEPDIDYAKNTILQAISTKAGLSSNQCFYIYMQGHATEDARFRVKGHNDDFISAHDLSNAFSILQSRTDCTIVLILESCFSGNFIPQLSGEKRVIITSAGNQQYPVVTNSQLVFSRYLLGKLREGKNFYDAHVSASNFIYKMGLPKALLDDNSDGISDSKDGLQAKTIYACNYPTLVDKPVIHSISMESIQSDSAKLSITVEILPFEVIINEISGSIASSYSFNSEILDLETFVLNKQENTVFSGIVSGLSTNSTNRIILSAKNRLGELSDPRVIAMNQKISLHKGWNLFSFSVNKLFYENEYPPDINTLYR